jgi:hypothetical protein
MNVRLPLHTLAQLDAVARREGFVKSNGEPNRTAAIRWLAARDRRRTATETATETDREPETEIETMIGQTVKFLRFGKPPVDGRSENHRDNVSESGVSVYLIENGQAQMVGWYFGFLARPAFRGTGIVTGYGSDGEPVVEIVSIRPISRKAAQKLTGCDD